MSSSIYYKEQFSEVFHRLLSKSGVSCYRISQYTGIDQAYLSRLRSGEKHDPSMEVIMKICFALVHFNEKIEMSDIEELLYSVGRTISKHKYY